MLDFIALFGAGIATFASPCVLPLAPILIASWTTAGSGPRARIYSTLGFTLGFTTTFVALGLGANLLVQLLAPFKPILFITAAGILAAFGLKMLGLIQARGIFSVLNRSWLLPDFSKKIPRAFSGLIFGLVFGLGWTPCVGPILGGVLTYVASQESSGIRGGMMLFSFSIGIALPLLALAAFSEKLNPVLTQLKGWLPKIEWATGFGLILFAIMLFNQARFETLGNKKIQAVSATDQNGNRISLGKQDGKTTRLVFFYSDHCPVCHAMESFLPDFEKDCASSRFEISKVNVDDRANSAAANRFQVRAVPTISLISPDGYEIAHLVGYQTEGRLREAAQVTTSAFCKNDHERKIPIPLPFDSTCELGKKC